MNGRTQYPETPTPVNLDGATTFRMPFWRWYVLTTMVGQVLLAILNLLPARLLRPGRFDWDFYFETLMMGSVLLPILLAPVMLVYILMWPVRIAPAGFRASDMWGRSATISWGSVRAVKPLHVPFVPFLRVYSTETSRVLWLPLFMRRYQHYADLVAQYAGDDHPVARELADRLDPS